MTTPLIRLRMPLNPKTLLLRSAYIDTQPLLQDWFMGLQECEFFIELDSIDIVTSQPTAPSFGHCSLIIIPFSLLVIFLLGSTRTLSYLQVFQSHGFGNDDAYHTFWMESLRLFHLVKKSLQHLYLHGYSNNNYIDINSSLHSSHLWPSRVEIMNGKLTLDSWYLITDRIRPVFDNLQVQAL
ncbi:hypothetical protein BT69DRAFT_1281798 [Atractiella rhizophila]|nr:hypothetical protein BT69DRAFT_1281798 [Atractiella rhizophila]